MKIVIAPFALRQTPDSRSSHWECSNEELIARTIEGFPNAFPGYRDGVLQVPIDPAGLFSSVVVLHEGGRVSGRFTARQPGEDPRLEVGLDVGEDDRRAAKQVAGSAWVILYRKDVLAEGNEGSDETADWEIICVNASPDVLTEPEPIPVMTLLANHFKSSGGTATNMSPEQLEAALRISFPYWKNKALLS